MASEEFLELLEEIAEGFDLLREQLEGADELVKKYLFTCVELPYKADIRFGVPVVQLNVYDAKVVNEELKVYAIPLAKGRKPLEEFKGWYVIEENDKLETLLIEVQEMVEQNREMLE